MKKRAFTVLFLLTAVFICVSINMNSIASQSRLVLNSVSAKTVDVFTERAAIFDCNIQKLTNKETVYYAAAKPTAKAAAELELLLSVDEYGALAQRLSAGKPVVVKTGESRAFCSDIEIIEGSCRYSDSLACHIIGYISGDGRGVSGIEAAYDGFLNDNAVSVYARFRTDALGRVMLGEKIEIGSENGGEKGVALTLDRDIQKITEQAMDICGINKGAAVVIEIESGAVRACVSRPAFDPNNIAASLNAEDSPLINRALLPFNVGSVFKPVVAVAALENGVDANFEYECTGSVMLNGVTFNCHNENGHGRLNLENAVAVSCNTYFIALARETGAENIIETARKFGFGQAVRLCDGLTCDSGNLPAVSEIDSKAALANISFGQGALTATPMHICAMMATLAGGGVYIQPYLVAGTVERGELVQPQISAVRNRAFSAETARVICTCLEKVVSEGSGKNARSSLVNCAGKTATAQTGKFENGEEKYNSWFAGYFPAEDPKYAVVIMKEEGVSGSSDCAPVFKIIAEKNN